ncbi:MAG: 3-oxoacyl-ACP reductase FabG [Pirellulales bacterium]|nr:3-oxoacyl-ACP reductase FabG [Pirellulales bacterium]
MIVDWREVNKHMLEITVNLKGKTALVTGGSRGIGRAIAESLGRCGVKVVVNYHSNAEAADETVAVIEAAGSRAWPVRADVSCKQEVDRLFEEVRRYVGDRLDILVNNAGGPGELTPIDSMTEESWDRCMAVNLKSVFLCTQAASAMLPDESGRIINVTSISARSGGGIGGAHYSAAKAGVSNFTRACAKEFAARKITVNGIAPGVIYTDIHKNMTTKSQLEELRRRIPLGYVGQAKDVAGGVLFLCSSQAEYITGEIIEINGGMLMN